MQSIEYNKENHSILNQIYDVPAELQAQDKKITLCKVHAHIGNKGNEEAKQATDISEMTMRRLLNTDYYLTTRRTRNARVAKGLGEQY